MIPDRDNETHDQEPRLLAMDAFPAHHTPRVREHLAKMRVNASIISDSCTGYVQPLDIAINQPLKALIKDASDRHRNRFSEEYENGKWRSVGERRVLLTGWVAEGWEELHKQYKRTIINAFRYVGMSLNTDGSEDGDIKIKGVEDFVVGDWRVPTMLAGDAEAAAAMPVSISSRKEKAKARRDALTLERASLLSSAMEGEEKEESEWIEIEEIEEEIARKAQEKTARRATRRENWLYFISGEPFKDNVGKVIPGEGRTRAGKSRFHERYFTAAEARDGVEDIFETDAELSEGEKEAEEIEEDEDEEIGENEGASGSDGEDGDKL